MIYPKEDQRQNVSTKSAHTIQVNIGSFQFKESLYQTYVLGQTPNI